MIKAEHISMRYFRKTGTANYFYAVQPTDLSIQPGELAVLMGRSGSGKTTLLNMLSGLLKPPEGTVRMDDLDLYSLDDRALSHLRGTKIAVVPQGRSAIDTLTVLENVLLPARLCACPLPVEAAVKHLEQLGIAHLKNARPPELSGGELRRMSIARALSQGPDILFADEPTSDLDDENTFLVLSMLRAFAHEEKKAVFVVTHENDARQYADRLYGMDGGILTEK